jgi:hypothetical protein
VTFLHHLLTAHKVAREFEFILVRQAVLQNPSPRGGAFIRTPWLSADLIVMGTFSLLKYQGVAR